MKMYTKEEVCQIRKGNIVVVVRSANRQEWDIIKEASLAANRGEEHACIEYLIDRGVFVRRTDHDITINTADGEATYPIDQVLLSVSTEFIEKELGTNY